MADVCEFHDLMVQAQKQNETAIEARVAKSSIKWLAGIFAIPTVGILIAALGFYASADYRYGSNLQAQNNAANIKLLDERTINLKQDIVKLQGDIQTDLSQIKTDLKEISRDLKYHSRGEDKK